MTRINEFTRIDKKIVHKELSLDFELDSCYLSIRGIRVQGFFVGFVLNSVCPEIPIFHVIPAIFRPEST